jgi:hypothetical protein
MKLIVAVCAFVFAASAADLLACGCITVGEKSDPMPSGSVVFRGKVVATELVVVGENGNMFMARAESEPAKLYRIAVFEVLEKFRGDIPPFVIVVTGSGAGDCGYAFKAGESYMVDGEWTEDETRAKLGGGRRAITTSICTLTAADQNAAAILERLRKRTNAASPLFIK